MLWFWPPWVLNYLLLGEKQGLRCPVMTSFRLEEMGGWAEGCARPSALVFRDGKSHGFPWYREAIAPPQADIGRMCSR